MSYTKLSIQEFGSLLLGSNDLDPVYVTLHRLLPLWGKARIGRWLVAYWCFYHCGFACRASTLQGSEFWDYLMEAAVNVTPAPTGGRWPRGRERRHFRGKQAVEAVHELHAKYPDSPEHMVESIASHAPVYKAVSRCTQSHRGFGPWIGFKVADMLDRCWGTKVDFDQAAVFMFKDPVQAAIMYHNQSKGLHLKTQHSPVVIREEIIPNVVEKLVNHFKGSTAPPLHERPIGLQEVETILCKWKSHMHGHYPLGIDLREIREGVEEWHDQEFLNCLPPLYTKEQS